MLIDLLNELSVCGLVVSRGGCNAIEVHGPVEKLTPALKQRLKQCKPQLLELLQPPDEELFPDWLIEQLRQCEVYWLDEGQTERAAIQDEHLSADESFRPIDFATEKGKDRQTAGEIALASDSNSSLRS